MIRITLCCLVLACVVAADDAGDGTQISGTLTFTCTPDEKSKKAGASSFEDTLEIGNDRVKSHKLTEEGFPVALSIPKTVNGIPTFNAAFKKAGVTATYFIRAKPGGDVSGSFTRVEGGKSLRYTIGSSTPHDTAKNGAPKTSDTMLDPEVLRVNGGFVRLMSVQVAMADAGVIADKAKLATILKSAGAEQNKLRTELLSHKLKPEQYAKQAETQLDAARKSVDELLGEKSAKVDAAYEAPFASGYVYLNRMRAAAAESNTTSSDAVKRADQVVVKSLLELANLAKKKGQLTPEAVTMLQDRTRAEVTAALGESQRERFEKMLGGLTSYKPK